MMLLSLKVFFAVSTSLAALAASYHRRKLIQKTQGLPHRQPAALPPARHGRRNTMLSAPPLRALVRPTFHTSCPSVQAVC